MGAFSLLLWKNWLLQKRRPKGTAVQVLLPILFVAILVGVRKLTNKNKEVMCQRGPDGQLVGTPDERSDCEFIPFNMIELGMLLPAAVPSSAGCVSAADWTIGYTPTGASAEPVERVMEKVWTNMTFLNETLAAATVSGYNSEDEMTAALNTVDSACRVGITFAQYPTQDEPRLDFQYTLRFDAVPGGYKPSQSGTRTERKTWHTAETFPAFLGQGPRGSRSYSSGCSVVPGLNLSESVTMQRDYCMSDSVPQELRKTCYDCILSNLVMDLGTDTPGYAQYLYLSWQTLVNKAIIQADQTLTDKSKRTAIGKIDNLEMIRMPYPQYVRDGFLYAIQFGLPLLLMLSFMYTALTITRNVVHEKEMRLKESMKMMGLPSWAHWAAWFVQAFLLLLVSSGGMALEIHLGAVLPHSDTSLIFVYLLCFSCATICFCFLLSTLFKRASTAAVVTAIMWFISYFPYQVISQRYAELTAEEKTQYCFISTTCMSIGAAVISELEGNGVGVGWDNWTEAVSPNDSFTFAHALFMMLFDAILYMLLTVYVEAVFPGEYGIPRKWYFPCTLSFWFGKNCNKSIKRKRHGTYNLLYEQEPVEDGDNTGSKTFEAAPAGAEAGIELRSLRKVFGNKVAVANSNIKMYKGEITALLGHNGAGKTTTMSMITGLFPPTTGTAIIDGHDVSTDVRAAQRSLGICPQHDVLFPTLTVEEHLRFFCRLKGVPSHRVMPEVDAMLASLQLDDKRHAASKTLSGGMKRRLSCGMAFVGGSKVVILDEPTSGMDPSARRATWDLIQRYAEGRTILLSTHFMDEADVLGDRIAIMSEGVIKCCGTSLFLKGLYGEGYSLVLLVQPTCESDRILQFVQKWVPEVTVHGHIGAEVTLLLPRSASNKFEELFSAIDAAKNDLGIRSYGCSVTTMEEVFLKVGEVAEEGQDEVIDIQKRINTQQRDNEVSERSALLPNASSSARVTGISLKVQQFGAMMKKRVRNTLRNKWTVLVQLIPPLFFTFLALEFANSNPNLPVNPARSMDAIANNYGSGAQILLASSTNPDNTFVNVTDPLRQISGVTPSIYPTALPSSSFVNDVLVSLSNGTTERAYNFNRYNPALLYINGDIANAQYECWFNGQGYHAVAECMMLAHSMIFANELSTQGSPAMAGFSSSNDPLPYTVAERAEVISSSDAGFNIAFSILFGTAPLIASFIIFLVKERESKAKHVQFVSGLDAYSYWGSNLIWDLFNYMIPICGIFILFAAFDVQAYIGDRFPITLTLFVLYGTSILPLVYCASNLFQNPSIAFVVMTVFNIATGLALMVTIVILEVIEKDTADILKKVFLILPNFCFGQGLSDLYTKYTNYHSWMEASKNQAFCIPPASTTGCPDDNYWSWDEPGVGKYCTAMAIETVVFVIMVIAIEQRLLVLMRNKFIACFASEIIDDHKNSNTDVDVQNEADRARANMACALRDKSNAEVVMVSDLQKTYIPSIFGPRKRAVNGISVSIPERECFGLLGVNGAGKTTTFKILTGDESMTSGKAIIKGYDVSNQMVAVRQHIGYCPQYDALIDVLTGREILTMFAQLRGMAPTRIAAEVDKLIQFLMLDKHADKQSRTYSGGNKRKLSTAIALVGDPALVFLDEPTTGMDVGARRFLWNALLQVLQSERSIILTSHSMEECEALCTRLAIMVNGEFKCIGSPQHLKSRFGQGYTLIARLRDMRGDTAFLRQFIESSFQNTVLKEDHLGLVRYEIQPPDSLAKIFGTMERGRSLLDIDDYSVSQATLEQVFLDFAKKQKSELSMR